MAGDELSNEWYERNWHSVCLKWKKEGCINFCLRSRWRWRLLLSVSLFGWLTSREFFQFCWLLRLCLCFDCFKRLQSGRLVLFGGPDRLVIAFLVWIVWEALYGNLLQQVEQGAEKMRCTLWSPDAWLMIMFWSLWASFACVSIMWPCTFAQNSSLAILSCFARNLAMMFSTVRLLSHCSPRLLRDLSLLAATLWPRRTCPVGREHIRDR